MAISERTIRRVVVLFNARGIDGLIEKKPKSGRPRKLSEVERKELIEKFESPIKDTSLPVWSARKFHGYIKEEGLTDLSYCTVLRLLKEEGFSLQVPRPWPIEQDEEKRRVFKEKLAVLLEDKEVELFYLDEVAFEGNSKPRRRWFEKGSRPKLDKQSERIRSSVCGMVCPRDGRFFALELPYIDRYTFQRFLDEANRDVASPRKRCVIILDNASWHKVKELDWGKFEPLFLPPYSPDLNPIERLWLCAKQEFFNGFISKTIEQLSDRICQAMLHFLNDKNSVASICAISI